jgi:hypothetical protein
MRSVLSLDGLKWLADEFSGGAMQKYPKSVHEKTADRNNDCDCNQSHSIIDLQNFCSLHITIVLTRKDAAELTADFRT